jgi:CHASE3 domain sensor protein
MKLPRWFLNTSIGSRLGWGFAVVVSLTLVYGGLTLRQMRDLEGQASLLFRHPFTVVRAVAEVELQVLKIHREMKDLANTLEPEDVP